MKRYLGVLSALLLAGTAVAEDMNTSTALPEAEKTTTINSASTAPVDIQETDTQAVAPVAPMEEKAMEQSGFSRGSVVRSIFTTSIDDREPVDNIKEFNNGNQNQRIYYYTELRDMTGQKAKHRWEFNGEVMAEVEFNVRGPRWRVWSSKNFVPQWTGDWKVTVLNGADEIISEEIISYKAAVATNIVEPEPVSADIQQ